MASIKTITLPDGSSYDIKATYDSAGNTISTTYINKNEKGAASGVAPLNSSGVIDSQYLPEDSDTTYVAISDTIGSATASGTISADEIDTWSAGTLPSLSYTARTVGSASGWSAGSVPSLSYTSRSVGSASGWSAGTAATASASKGVLTINNGTAPSLTISSVSCDDITAWDEGSVPSLTITSTACDDITGWTAGTLPALETTTKNIPNISVSSVEVVTGFIQNGDANLSYNQSTGTLIQS